MLTLMINFKGVSMGQNPLIDRKHYEDHVLALLEKDSFKSLSIADQIEQMKKFENEDFDQHNSIHYLLFIVIILNWIQNYICQEMIFMIRRRRN